MIEFVGLIGLLIGTLSVWASDYVPRFSANYTAPAQTAKFTPVPTLALWAFTKARLSKKKLSQEWLALHLGVELLSALVYAFLYVQYGPSPTLLLHSAIFSFLCLVATVDLKYRLVPNVLTYPAMIAVLIGQVILAQHSLLSIALGGGLAFGIFFLTARLKPDDLGGGDVKLATLIGLAFGFPGVLIALIAGAGTGALVAVILAARRHGEKLYFPYAPFLCLGAMMALLYSPYLTIR